MLLLLLFVFRVCGILAWKRGFENFHVFNYWSAGWNIQSRVSFIRYNGCCRLLPSLRNFSNSKKLSTLKAKLIFREGRDRLGGILFPQKMRNFFDKFSPVRNEIICSQKIRSYLFIYLLWKIIGQIFLDFVLESKWMENQVRRVVRAHKLLWYPCFSKRSTILIEINYIINVYYSLD